MGCPLGRMFKAGRIFALVESIKIFKGPTNNQHSLLALLYHMLYVGIFCLIFLLYSLFPNLHESFLLSSCLKLTVVKGGEDGDANVTSECCDVRRPVAVWGQWSAVGSV